MLAYAASLQSLRFDLLTKLITGVIFPELRREKLQSFIITLSVIKVIETHTAPKNIHKTHTRFFHFH